MSDGTDFTHAADAAEHLRAVQRSQHRHLCAMAAYVGSLEHVMLLLGQTDSPSASLSVRCLPPPLRAAPLHALGLRLMALPATRLGTAIELFLDAAAEVPREQRGEALQTLVDAALAGPSALEQREHYVMREATSAVEQGENVDKVCRRLGVTLPGLRLRLDNLAVHCQAPRPASQEAGAAMRHAIPLASGAGSRAALADDPHRSMTWSDAPGVAP